MMKKFEFGEKINTPEGIGEVMNDTFDINSNAKVKVKLGPYYSRWFDKSEILKLN